jgi:hypothetical protein
LLPRSPASKQLLLLHRVWVYQHQTLLRLYLVVGASLSAYAVMQRGWAPALPAQQCVLQAAGPLLLCGVVDAVLQLLRAAGRPLLLMQRGCGISGPETRSCAGPVFVLRLSDPHTHCACFPANLQPACSKLVLFGFSRGLSDQRRIALDCAV